MCEIGDRMRKSCLARRAVLTLLAVSLSGTVILGHGRPSRMATVLRIDSIAAGFVKDSQAIGLSIAVVKGNDALLVKGYGAANWELGVPTQPSMVYPIASM